MPLQLTIGPPMFDIGTEMDVERIIDEIEQLQEMFEAPDIRPLSPRDLLAANRRHDKMLAHTVVSPFGSSTGFAAAPSLQ